jgi:DnaJ-class molecular chaperone
MAVLKSVMGLLINGNAASVNAKSGPRSAIPGALVEVTMANDKGPNIKKKQKCKNCEGKGLLKKGDKVVKCQRCGGTGFR